jgi:hypothetical protein
MAHIQAFAAKYPALSIIGVEKWGKGETFKDMLLYNTKLPIVPCPFAGMTVKSKGQRFQAEGGLAPMFVDGRLWVSSDFSGDFYRTFEDEWIGWDGSRSITGNDDCLDAVYWMAYVAQGHLVPVSSRTYAPKQRGENPYDAIAQLY